VEEGRSGAAERRAPGELEAEVLAVLWTVGRPATAAEVRHRIDGTLAYTTVMTILARLYEKGVVSRSRCGRRFAYAPVDDAAGLAARRMRKLLDAGPDRSSVLARFVSDLTEEDERVLRAVLREAVQE
jgi:predicted transcriptional regulator